MSRPDESITYLKDKGYCVFRIPRPDAKPLQTLMKAGKKDLVRLGDLATISAPGTNQLPPLSVDNEAPVEISGKESSSTKVEVGVTILGGLLNALGGKDLGVSAGFTRAKALTFKFEDVLEDDIDLDKLDQYLSTCTFRSDGLAVINALLDDAVFVTTSTLKSTKFTVNAKGDSGTKVGLDVPAISGVASGSLNVDLSRATEGVVTFQGSAPVVFAFQAVQVFTDERGGQPVYSAVDPLKAGAAAARAVGKLLPTYLETEQGAFVRMKEE